MKWLLVGFIVVAVLIIAVVIFGLFQPVKHSVTRTIRLKQKPEAVFAILDNIEGLSEWSAGVEKVERLPDRDGKRTARITLCWGMKMILTRLERTPPSRLVESMAREGGCIMGTWTYSISSEGEGCRVALSENGELKSPIMRAFARIRGLDANITQTLGDLAKKFGESPAIQREN